MWNNLQNEYFNVLSEAEQLVITVTPLPQNINTSANLNSRLNEASITSDNINNEAPVQSARSRRVKLPEATLPSFSGRYEEWLSFKDEFTSLIHEQDDLTNIQKLQYLKSAVTGEAAKKIKTMSITDENYHRAWTLLEKAYADERLIISKHLSLLLRLPVQTKETAEGLCKLADDTLQHVESLAALGVNVSEEILVQNLEEKLHKNTVDKWDETIKGGSFPKLDQMTEFVYITAKRLSKRDKEPDDNWKYSQRVNHKSLSQLLARKKDKPTKGQTLLTNATNKCKVCLGKFHPLHKCKKFYSFGFDERLQAAKEASVCLTCLRLHEGKECKFKKCMVCENPNHFSLHDHQTRVNNS